MILLTNVPLCAFKEKTCSPHRRGHQLRPRLSPTRGLMSRQGTAREGQRVLSHLPLHSQPLTPSSGLSLMIPIGGIQMVQSRLGLHTSRLGHHSNQKTQNVLGKQREVKGNPANKDQQPRGRQNPEPDDKTRDAPTAPLTTWKSISQRKERKRIDRASARRTSPLTHFPKSTLIKHNTQTSTDIVAMPKSTWSERASSISSMRENSIRERSLVSVPGANAAKVDRVP